MNPNPGLITDEMWRLWTNRPNSSWKLGGIYADKKGYHNTVNNNIQFWPNNYSIRLPLDLVDSNRSKARAIDYTMSDSEMVLATGWMKRAAEHPLDSRLFGVKEFYGTLDNKTVFGLSKDSGSGVWRKSTADDTHLWHLHISIFTVFVNRWDILERLLSVLKGESFEDWQSDEMKKNILDKGDVGQLVKYYQHMHQIVRKTVSPESPSIEIDGEYGDSTAAAFVDFYRKSGGTDTTYNGSYLSAWIAIKYQTAFNQVTASKPTEIDEVVKTAVNAYLVKNVGTEFDIAGKVEGRLIQRAVS